jgi:hypothetical protein
MTKAAYVILTQVFAKLKRRGVDVHVYVARKLPEAPRR